MKYICTNTGRESSLGVCFFFFGSSSNENETINYLLGSLRGGGGGGLERRGEISITGIKKIFMRKVCMFMGEILLGEKRMLLEIFSRARRN